MQLLISIREANQHLSRYLERVERGDEVVITRRGTPVARLIKTDSIPELTTEQQGARERLRSRLSQGYSLDGVTVDRDEIHTRGSGDN